MRFPSPWRRRLTPWRRRSTSLWPWVFVLGIAIGSLLPDQFALRWPSPGTPPDNREIWQQPTARGERLAAKVLYVVDGDTFSARLRLSNGSEITERVRLRGIDAPEMKGQCADELRRAEAAATALRAMLAEGGVTITNIGPDKYGRVLADVATKRTDNVAAALIAAGHGRPYNGGHRGGWCPVR